MRTISRVLAGAVLLWMGTANAWANGRGGAASGSNASVFKAADELAAAVRSRNVEAILLFVAPDGVPCIDATVSRKDVEKQLRTHGTWLNAYFLEPDAFKHKFADGLTPMSFAEFLATARDLRVTMPAKQHPRFPCVTFAASNIEFRASFCFRRYGHRWVLGDLPNCG